MQLKTMFALCGAIALTVAVTAGTAYAAEKVCGFTWNTPVSGCNDCPCNGVACDANSLSAEKWFLGMNKCVDAPEQVCLTLREDQWCATVFGFDAADCMGEIVCWEDKTTSINCEDG